LTANKDKTFSKLIFLIDNRKDLLIYKLSLVLKGLLDFIFIYYVYTSLNSLELNIFLICALTSPIMFGILSLYTQDKSSNKHYFVTYLSGGTWFISAFYITYLIRNSAFTTTTYTLLPIIIAIVTFAHFKNKVNIFLQASIVTVMWLWTLLMITLI
jgi:hypothetical protein